MESGDRREPPGLGGPRTRRSAATSDMAGGAGEEEREASSLLLPCVLSLPAPTLPVAVSCLDATVPRKPRTRRPRGEHCVWWTFRLRAYPLVDADNPPAAAEGGLPVLLGIPAPGADDRAEEARASRSQRLRVRLAPPKYGLLDPAAPASKKAGRFGRRCLQCGSTETPQWRSGPMGRTTLCNACGVRLKALGALRDQGRPRPPRPAARTVAEPPPQQPESPVSDSPPSSPIWKPGSVPDVYLVRRKPPKRAKLPPPTPRTEAPPAPAQAPAIYLVKKKKKKKKKKKPPTKTKAWRLRKTSAKRCMHCGSSSTPQWREGPMGRSTLCNACGVRYRQGRLLPEYRPAASPTFSPSEHANRHSQVLQLHLQRNDGNDHRAPPSPEHQPQPVDNGLRVGGNSDSTDAPVSGVDDDVLQLRRRWHQNEYPPTPLHQPLPQPLDGLGSDLQPANLLLPAGGIVDSANAAAGGSGDGDGDGDCIDPDAAPCTLDSMLLDGPSAPLIVDGDKPLID